MIALLYIVPIGLLLLGVWLLSRFVESEERNKWVLAQGIGLIVLSYVLALWGIPALTLLLPS